MTEFKVIDSIMGSGKTQFAIQHINESDETDSFIYITPYLNEVQRVRESVTNRTMYEPETGKGSKTKLEALKSLIRGGLDIATTHALFQTADSEVIELLREHNYHLILDEQLEVVQQVKGMTRHDIEILHSIAKLIEVDEKGNVQWLNDDIGPETQYELIYLLSKAGNLYMSGNKAFVTLFNDRIFKSFKSVIVCTYLFKYSEMRMYFETLGIDYITHAVSYDEDTQKYTLIDYDPKSENRTALYDLMNVYEGKYNDNVKRMRLSTSGLKQLTTFQQGREQLNDLAKNIRNFFINHREEKAGICYWSTIKDMHDYIRPQSFKGEECRMSITEKATNKYADGQCLAYIYDRYPNPNIKHFFTGNDVEFHDDGWAVADVLQWIFRSRIRNGQDIQLYMPAKRMRKLLKQWAEYEL